MNTILYKASDRGAADYGWLKAKYSFSFSSYHNPSNVHFGALRVLNNDIVAGGGGFPAHPHDNMEIITIPIEGALQHKDSSGGNGIIQKNDVQIMNAGTGVEHSEFNASKTEQVELFQIWIFPKEKNIKPRYDQKTFDPAARQNKLQLVVAPDNDEALWINQDAWLSLGNLNKGISLNYKLHNNNSGVYAFVIEGSVTINGQPLGKRDALGIKDAADFDITANENAEILLIEIPV